MGLFALKELELPRQSFDLLVVHHTPHEVQYSCMADGATAATGASVGKLNLELVEATTSGVETTYLNRATGKSITLRPRASFVARFGDVPREKLAAVGKEVLLLPDEALFEEVRTRGGS
jgi:formylmethanofuran dehydrogenase subunit E